MFNSGHLGSTSNLKQKEAIDSENQWPFKLSLMATSQTCNVLDWIHIIIFISIHKLPKILKLTWDETGFQFLF